MSTEKSVEAESTVPALSVSVLSGSCDELEEQLEAVMVTRINDNKNLVIGAGIFQA